MIRRAVQRARKRALARGDRGFTLIEMLVAVSLGTVVVLPVMGLSISMSRNDLGAQQDKTIADDFGLLQMYVPRDVAQATSAATTGADCVGGTAAQGAGGTVKLVLVTRGTSPTRVVYSDAAPSSADSGGTLSLYRRQCNDTTGALTGAVEMVTGAASATTITCTSDPAHPTESCWTVRVSVGKKRTATAGPTGLGLLRTGAVSATRRPDRRLNATGISASPNPVRMGNPVAFTSTWDSVDGAAISSYKWDFGDGTSGTTQNATHTYPTLAAGVNSKTYTVTVVATTSAGSSSTRSIDVVVKRPEVLVSTTGTDNATCGDTATTTCRTVAYALTKTNRNTIWIAAGTYAPFTTGGGWTIKGGYDTTFTTSSAATPTNIDGTVDATLDAAFAVRVNAASSALVLDTLRIRAMNNPGTLGTGVGRSTYGLIVADSGSNVTLNSVTVIGGTAGAGNAGVAGTAATQSAAAGGGGGTAGNQTGSLCDTARRGGGGGGGGVTNGGGGGAGGAIDSSCSFFNYNYDATGGYSGGGGATVAGSCTPAGGGGGGGAPNAAWWGGTGSDGGQGGAGCNGAAGASGAASAATAGSLNASGIWQAPASVNGGTGVIGTHGAGGGGGGGGGASDGGGLFTDIDDYGAGGGGGGAGGARATSAGTGGFGGGASIAVLVRNSTVTATGLSITKGTGGAGGAGGAGALGQPGGPGGPGGARWESAGAGGNGGAGGRGGPSGAGSGGSGGPSFGLVTTSSGSLTGATFAAGGAGGAGGTAGAAVSGGTGGAAGQNGLLADTRAL